MESAGEALVLAFLVLLLGGVAVEMVGDLWRNMTPSLPPVMAGKQVLETEPSPVWNACGAWLHRHRFALIFGLLFAAKSAARLFKHSGNESHRQAAATASRILHRVSEEWFGLVVINAFTASWLTMVLQWSQAFSWTQLVWHSLAASIRPAIHALAGVVPGANLLGTLFAWYQTNQVKFTFWLLYSAAICDDLGLPNYKCLWRWMRRRVLQRRQARKPL